MRSPCSKEKEIAEIDTKLSVVYKMLMGNGQPGLQEQVIKLTSAVENHSKTNEILTTAVSGLTKFRTETETEIKVKAVNETDRKWMITTIIALASIVSTLLVKIIFF